MTAAPAVSVILPTYNRAHLLPRAIASVLGQSFTDLELIVVDDGSRDGTAAVVEAIRDPRLVFLPPERNLGDAGARNRGIAHARGTWLAFQDSDDEWMLHKLAAQMALASRLGPEYGAVASSLLRMVGPWAERIDWPAQSGAEGWGDVERARFVEGFCAYLQTLLVRRSAFDHVGAFSTELRARSDFEFTLRLLGSFRIAAQPDLLAVSHETPDSISLRNDYRLHDLQHIMARHGAVIEGDRRAAARCWYNLGKTQLAAAQRGPALRSALAAIAREPARPLPWALLALIPAGPAPLNALSRLSQGLRRRRPP